VELSDAAQAMIAELHDREQIRELMYRYARGVDRGDIELLTSVFWAEGTDKHGHFDGPAAEFARGVVQRGDAVKIAGNHHITNMIIDIDGDRAHVETYFLAFHPHNDSQVRVEMGVMSGRYIDVLERRDGSWKILRRQVISDWTREDFGGPPWLRTTADYGGFLRGVRGDGDPSYQHFRVSDAG